jgi:hypothetical protein
VFSDLVLRIITIKTACIIRPFLFRDDLAPFLLNAAKLTP